MRSVPEVTLTIAGEIWGPNRGVIGGLASDPALAGRVEIRDGYVPADALAALLADHDVLALPYRSATASQNVILGHAHGLPVLASDIAPFSQQVVDGVNGLLVPPEDERALAGALRRLGDPDVRRRLAEGVQTPDLSGPWAHYLGTLEALSVDETCCSATPPGGRMPPRPTRATVTVPTTTSTTTRTTTSTTTRIARVAGRRSGGGRARPGQPGRVVRGRRLVSGAARRVAGRARRSAARAVAARRPLVSLRPDDLPDWVLATDVLGEPDEADDARRLSRILGLPWSLDSVSAWAALGALAAILRVRDDGRRSAVIVDEGGTRSLLSRWARAVGFAPVEIDFTGAHPSVAALDVDTGSLDVIVRIHPTRLRRRRRRPRARAGVVGAPLGRSARRHRPHRPARGRGRGRARRRARHPRPGPRPRLRARRRPRRRRQRADARGRGPRASRRRGIRPRPADPETALSTPRRAMMGRT